ncbi:putative F-box associated interaction domain-containing protein [Helianthus annuus]|nr:putative F-box associated interaction domain-containing protein [Helianthus annuus]KAJ0642626.1 putative F-box associated interaction domain-containing protein [Helianthus annuus]KAJ0646503.1 putative F-box associated interaction domain-containing protein [Helianthus annuus]KAJ0823206.1 putative F-box associated interaction domain-containing protein [Helianthus annuus]
MLYFLLVKKLYFLLVKKLKFSFSVHANETSDFLHFSHISSLELLLRSPLLAVAETVQLWFGDIESITSIPHQVEVFTLSTGAWRSPYGGSSNLPRKSIQFSDFYSIVIDGVLYSVATDRIKTDAGIESSNLIVSFDLTSEEFQEIYLPPHLEDYQGEYSLSVSKLWESLVVLERNEVGDATIVWRMDDDDDDDDDDGGGGGGVPERSFTKLFTINTPHAYIIAVHAFRKSGESIIIYIYGTH